MLVSKVLHASVVGLVLLATTACQSPQGGGPEIGPRAGLGAAAGAAGGGLLGAALGGGAVGIAAGVLLGGLAGGAIGDRLDQADRARAQAASARALETLPAGQSATWQNPDSGNSGSVTPVRTFQSASGAYCREFQQTITIGGESHQGFGTACRQPDGHWRIVS